MLKCEMQRDIQKSHNFRDSVNKWGEPRSRKRVFVVSAPLSREKCVTEVAPTQLTTLTDDVSQSLLNVDQQIQRKESEYDLLKSWIGERQLLRERMNSLGLTTSWFENKSAKTACESNVYRRMITKKEEAKDGRDVIPNTFSRKPRFSAAHVDLLPFLNSPLPIALAMIADYLMDNRLRLIDLFREVDKNKDWKMTRDELKQTLKVTRMPLTDAHLDDLIMAVDSNNDDQLSYKELAKGIEAYHKDRRWQKLKSMYDNIVDDDTQKRRQRRSSVSEGKAVVDLLLLPKFDSRNCNNTIKEQRSKKIQHRRQRMKADDGDKRKDGSLKSTFTGELGKQKLKYIEILNKECDRCNKVLLAEGIFVAGRRGVREILVPPPDNSYKTCKMHLSSNLSLYPRHHALNEHYEKQRKRRIRKATPEVSITSDLETQSEVTVKEYGTYKFPLPRVASLDSKGRIEDARKTRRQLMSTSPTLCWPQHLLDKMRLCLDDSPAADGKSVMFNYVKL